jgi:hypothetical protein
MSAPPWKFRKHEPSRRKEGMAGGSKGGEWTKVAGMVKACAAVEVLTTRRWVRHGPYNKRRFPGRRRKGGTAGGNGEGGWRW